MSDYMNSSDDQRSRLFGPGRVFDLDSLDNWQEVDFPTFWPSDERPPDPKAYIIRQVIKNHLKPAHQEVLEGVFFEGKAITHIADERGVTPRAARAMLQRAIMAFKRELLAHAQEYKNVPANEC